MSYQPGDIVTFELLGQRRDCLVVGREDGTLTIQLPRGERWPVPADSPALTAYDGRPCGALVERDYWLKDRRRAVKEDLYTLTEVLWRMRQTRERAMRALTGIGVGRLDDRRRARLVRIVNEAPFGEAEIIARINAAQAVLGELERRIIQAGGRTLRRERRERSVVG